MWLSELIAAIIGLSGGMVVATALAAFIIGLGIIHTGHNLLLYEDALILGTFLGNIFYLYQFHLPLGQWGLAVIGIFFGMFLGSWIIALGEVVNVFAIMARRVGLTKGVGLVVLSIAIGKTLASLIQFFVMT